MLNLDKKNSPFGCLNQGHLSVSFQVSQGTERGETRGCRAIRILGQFSYYLPFHASPQLLYQSQIYSVQACEYTKQNAFYSLQCYLEVLPSCSLTCIALSFALWDALTNSTFSFVLAHGINYNSYIIVNNSFTDLANLRLAENKRFFQRYYYCSK